MKNDKELAKLIQQKAKELFPRLVEIRRYLHANPELSFQETNTSAFIKRILKEHEIAFTDQWVRTGIVAEIGNQTTYQSTVALRADMDALPIQEQNETAYKSVNEGIMHACGHDVHSTCLLGALMILKSLDIEWHNRMIGIFQPGEEKLPGGAALMITEGLLDQYKPDEIFGLHVQPQMEVGNVGFCPGQSMASSDEIYIKVIGKGGHAAMPHLLVDPILIASRIVTGIQEIISRNADPMSPCVLSFGKFRSEGGATNVIPDSVKLEGTFRAMDETWREKAHILIRQFVTETCAASGGICEIDIVRGYPCLVNNDNTYKYGKQQALHYLGEDKVLSLPARMTSEDFAYYSQQVPTLFFRLGTGNASLENITPVHTNSFDVDESCLEIGAGLMAYMAAQKMI